MKILFVGCVESSYKLLKALFEKNKNVVGVVTKEKSNFNSDFVDLQPICNEYNIPCHFATNINKKESLSFIHSCKADICYCFGWSQLLHEECISLFPKGVVGFHPAALPYNRGRHPLIWALALGLEKTASTFFMINTRADEGDIISQKYIDITYEDDARTLYNKVMSVAVEQEIEFTDTLEKGTAVVTPQDVAQGNAWRKREKADGQIDWRMSSYGIYNLVRSLTRPYVGAHFVHDDNEYKVWRVIEIDDMNFKNIEPGKVLAVNNDGTIDVKAGSGIVRLVEFDKVQVNAGDYL